ncbi:MAG: AAA family ATPase [Planctomycetota bacterium]
MSVKMLAQALHLPESTAEMAVACLASGGHLLIEGPPGTGKSRLCEGIAKGFDLPIKRIQGTPDLMPMDLTGSEILNADGSRSFRPGPIFSPFVQVDEINRISPRALSSVLEAMQERAVTVGDHRHNLPSTFHVLATRSMRESEGVYSLPEAVLDRFMVSLRLSLPDHEAEMASASGASVELARGCLGSLEELQERCRRQPCSERLARRAVDCTRLTRDDPGLRLGAGVRGGQHLVAVAKSLSVLRGERSATLQALHDAALPVLSHRLRPGIFDDESTRSHVERAWSAADPAAALDRMFARFLS